MMRLALGTVQFGLTYGIANTAGQVPRPEAKAMLEMASDQGIDTLDTAIGYGESETCLGEAGIQNFRLVTKLPAIPEHCDDINAWVQAQFSASLTRLGVSRIYGLLLHRSEQLLGPNGKVLYQALLDLKNNGQVKKIGISIYSPEQLALIKPHYPLDLVQAPFNLVDRRLHQSGWMRRLKDAGIELHIRSVFLQGLLLMPQAAIPPSFAPWKNLWDKWHQWLPAQNTSAIQACLAFVLSFPEIDRLVVGADNLDQLAQIIVAAGMASTGNFPDLECDEERLVNPSFWPGL